MEDYGANVVSEWSIEPYLDDLNRQCAEDCNRTCTTVCPEAKLCHPTDEIRCGKDDLPPTVWPDCIHDDICVPKDCECKVEGNDGSLCPLWCVTTCNEVTHNKCPGGIDDNGCKERDVCVEKPVGDNNQICPGYCPVECDYQHEHICSEPEVEGCPQPPTC